MAEASSRIGRMVGPQTSTAVLIPNIERLARRVADGIVRPRRELVLAAVHRPREARARLGGLETEIRVGHHVDPGSRGPLPLAQSRDVLAAVRCESPQAVEELEIQRRKGKRSRSTRAARGADAEPAPASTAPAEPPAQTMSPGAPEPRLAPQHAAGSGPAAARGRP